MSWFGFIRWFNKTIEPLPLDVTLIAGGAIWCAAFVAMAWAGIWVVMLPGLIFPGLR